MDLNKIGKYIAVKRKALNLTQKELASKIGISDKSVSKWERGICLPDVSLFEDLCSNLNISVNEFLAGEDIETKNLNLKADENIISLAKDSKRKEKNLKLTVILISVVAIMLASFIGYSRYKELSARNTISRLDYDSSKVQAVELLLGPGTAHIYDFEVEDFEKVFLHVATYCNGEMKDNSSTGLFFKELVSIKKGELIIGVDLNNYVAKLAYKIDGCTTKTEIPLIEEENDKTAYGLTSTPLNSTVKVEHNKEIPILALIFDRDEVRTIDLSKPIDNQKDNLLYDEYVYVFSIEFKK